MGVGVETRWDVAGGVLHVGIAASQRPKVCSPEFVLTLPNNSSLSEFRPAWPSAWITAKLLFHLIRVTNNFIIPESRNYV